MYIYVCIYDNDMLMCSCVCVYACMYLLESLAVLKLDLLSCPQAMMATNAPTCLVNNVMQTGAAEGLAFLSGAAVAGQKMGARQVRYN